MLLYHKTVLVEPEAIAATTSSGIFIQTNTPTNQRNGTVKATGPECDTVKPGQRITYFSRRAIPIDELHLINEDDDILAIL